ncbi:EamA family transporter RarD [Lysinibacter sp. HNR]|uniref:EamA family transporter RarD n=1 Tax=Lysinibacter sp. HNR TaxID=3031408 RepID=UPI00243569DB|nr:EamA family transporter RarD [Lysinibacter sp. HNR]WGD36699.1 EamA family transporter RarD [Lysinibacter sp. HNR]
MNTRSGLIYAVGAYLLWGIAPAYFLLVGSANVFEIVPWRILFSLAFCAILLTAMRGWGQLRILFKSPRTIGFLMVAGVLIYINWQLFVLLILDNNVVEASLGYFINPLVTVLLGVLFLREKLALTQWVALGVAFIAVLILTLNYGRLPWAALVLAMSFGLYGLVKKKMGVIVGAVAGLTVETVLLAPIAIVQLVVVSQFVALSFIGVSLTHTLLLCGLGVITAVPLLLFAAGARRSTLTQLGLTQFLAPILQFLFGVFVLGENMPSERWLGFSLVWVAILIVVWGTIRGGRRGK